MPHHNVAPDPAGAAQASSEDFGVTTHAVPRLAHIHPIHPLQPIGAHQRLERTYIRVAHRLKANLNRPELGVLFPSYDVIFFSQQNFYTIDRIDHRPDWQSSKFLVHSHRTVCRWDSQSTGQRSVPCGAALFLGNSTHDSMPAQVVMSIS